MSNLDEIQERYERALSDYGYYPPLNDIRVLFDHIDKLEKALRKIPKVRLNQLAALRMKKMEDIATAALEADDES